MTSREEILGDLLDAAYHASGVDMGTLEAYAVAVAAHMEQGRQPQDLLKVAALIVYLHQRGAKISTDQVIHELRAYMREMKDT